MREVERETYKEALRQIPVRTAKMRAEVMKRYDNASAPDHKRSQFKFAVPAALFMALLLLSVAILPKKNVIPLKVYAASGEYVTLGKEAVILKPQYEPYLVTYSTTDDNRDKDYSCVFRFDIGCESEEVNRITYKIIGEKTASDSKEFGECNIWFVEITDRKTMQSDNDHRFVYRYIESESEKEAFTYLGSELTVEENGQDSGSYFIEYKIGKDENGNFQAEPFDVQVLLVKKGGSVTERILKFEPRFRETEDKGGGVETVNELWVTEK
jgi:hypothetical protein